MINRRSFLKAATGSVLAAPTLDFLRTFLYQHDKPFLETVYCGRDNHLTKLYLNNDYGEGEYRVLLETPSFEPPDFNMTYAEFAEEYLYGWEELAEIFANDADEETPPPRGSDTVDADWAFEHWWPNHSPDAEAFDFLDALDLGLFNSSHEACEGWIEFTNGVCPGNDSRFVDVDALGASLLQRRLIERGHAVQVLLAQ